MKSFINFTVLIKIKAHTIQNYEFFSEHSNSNFKNFLLGNTLPSTKLNAAKPDKIENIKFADTVIDCRKVPSVVNVFVSVSGQKGGDRVVEFYVNFRSDGIVVMSKEKRFKKAYIPTSVSKITK